MLKEKSNGTPFKKKGVGVRCFVTFEIGFGSYLESRAKRGLRHFVAVSLCHIDSAKREPRHFVTLTKCCDILSR